MTGIPTELLLRDLEDCYMEIQLCRLAAPYNIVMMFDGNFTAEECLDMNRQLVKNITAELQRRNVKIPSPE